MADDGRRGDDTAARRRRRSGSDSATAHPARAPVRRMLATASTHQIAAIDERYLSIALDIGQIAEPTRFWNPKGHGETDARSSFDFSRGRLRTMTAALAPCYLRIGGTEADRCLYALQQDAATAGSSSGRRRRPSLPSSPPPTSTPWASSPPRADWRLHSRSTPAGALALRTAARGTRRVAPRR